MCPQLDNEGLNGTHTTVPSQHPQEHDLHRASGQCESDEAAAALTIQRHYRGYAARKELKGMHMGSEARWNELMKHTEERNVAEEQLDNKNDVKSRWRRGVKAAARLQAGDAIHPTSTLAHPTSSSSSDNDGRGNAEAGPSRSNRPVLDKNTKKARRARFWGKLTMPAGRERDESEELPFQSKALEQQHWLEMIDGKHRYGSNLKYYFREWKEADTKDNFFRWLDRGEGKNLDLEELPRDRLEKERITYLSAEQRLNYLVRIDEDGLIRWAHNNELVDTAAGKWRDSGDGTGIVPDESYTGPNAPDKRLYASPHADRAIQPPNSLSGEDDDSDTSSVSSDSYGAGSELQENEATHYDEFAERDGQKGWMERKIKEITPGGMKKELLRKTLRGNTWIYASDMKMNLFVGIKQSGTFQHSSFIAGGKVTSAGIIVVKRGVIKKLNPWSGHYRSTIAHYGAFIAQLEDKGTDLSHVKVGKSVMQMWGLGKYTAITKGQKGLIDDVKRKLHLKHEPDEMEKSAALQKKVEEGERKAKEKEGGQGGQNGSAEPR